MAYTIRNTCFGCGTCQPQCSKGAIKVEDEQFWIDASLCDECATLDAPQCAITCPVNSLVPLLPKKGRTKMGTNRLMTSPDLFLDGKTHPLASSIVIWESSNILTQRNSLSWEVNQSGILSYTRQISQNKGVLSFWLCDLGQGVALNEDGAAKVLESFDIRAACMNLIYAAYATNLNCPWEEEFIVSDRTLERYLGLDKRKDLSKLTKLNLIKEIAIAPCQIFMSVNWSQQGKIKGFNVDNGALWQLLEIKHQFQEDDQGCKHLAGFTLRIKPGIWTKYFLNKQGCKEQSAYYQYGILPKSLLNNVMSIWQQHEGATRLMFWLLFKAKIGHQQKITVPTLMKIAYGAERLNLAAGYALERKRLLRMFESDLEVLSHYQIKAIFDPVTYQADIQPLWAKLADLPDDADEALDFWINDGSSEHSVTDQAPKGKWNLLMNARILCFEFPSDWGQKTEVRAKKTKSHRAKTISSVPLSGAEILAARKKQGISQRELAKLTGKSQSWIRDLENGRLAPKSEDQAMLRKVLALS